MGNDFFEIAKNKIRTIDDLALFLKNKVDDEILYCFLLGAGASVSSGIKTGQSLVEEWRNDCFHKYYPDLKIDNVEEKIKKLKELDWYKEEKEYSSLFGNLYDLKFQRKNYIEKQVGDKDPSIGYKYLNFLTSERYIDTFFTTNFDDLLEKSITYRRPIVCSHDSSIANISITSQRTKIIKLHGDFLFSTLKATNEETEYLDPKTKAKFEEFLKNYGLITIGYAGNDDSVMNVLKDLIKKDYLNNGLYWCLRKEDWESQTLSPHLKELLLNDKAFIILIDNFDEFCAELAHKIVNKKEIPIFLDVQTREHIEKRKKYYKTQYDKFKECKIIQMDINAQLSGIDVGEEQVKEDDTLLTKEDFSKISKIENSDNILSMEEREIKELIETNKYDDALSLIDKFINQKELPSRLYNRYLVLKVKCYEKLENNEKAVKVLDKIIKYNNEHKKESNIPHLLKKATLTYNQKEKIELLEEAYKLDIYDSDIINKLAEENADLIKSNKDSKYQKVIDLLNQSITINPAPSNEAYLIKLVFVKSIIENDQEIINTCNEIINKMNTIAPYSLCAYRAKIEKEFRNIKLKNITQDEGIKLIQNIYEEYISKNNIYEYNIAYLKTYLNILSELKEKSILENIFKDNDILFKEEIYYIIQKSRIYLSCFGNLSEAINVLESIDSGLLTIDKNRRRAYFLTYLEYLNYNNQNEKALKTIEEQPDSIKLKKMNVYLDIIYKIDKSKFLDAIFEKYKNLKTVNDYIEYSYNLIRLGEYEDVYKLYQDLLKDPTKLYINAKEDVLWINYNIAKKYGSKKSTISKNDLKDITETKENSLAKAAAYILLDNEEEAKRVLKKKIEKDFSYFYEIQNQPIFATLNYEELKVAEIGKTEMTAK